MAVAGFTQNHPGLPKKINTQKKLKLLCAVKNVNKFCEQRQITIFAQTVLTQADEEQKVQIV